MFTPYLTFLQDKVDDMKTRQPTVNGSLRLPLSDRTRLPADYRIECHQNLIHIEFHITRLLNMHLL